MSLNAECRNAPSAYLPQEQAATVVEAGELRWLRSLCEAWSASFDDGKVSVLSVDDRMRRGSKPELIHDRHLHEGEG